MDWIKLSCKYCFFYEITFDKHDLTDLMHLVSVCFVLLFWFALYLGHHWRHGNTILKKPTNLKSHVSILKYFEFNSFINNYFSFKKILPKLWIVSQHIKFSWHFTPERWSFGMSWWNKISFNELGLYGTFLGRHSYCYLSNKELIPDCTKIVRILSHGCHQKCLC